MHDKRTEFGMKGTSHSEDNDLRQLTATDQSDYEKVWKSAAVSALDLHCADSVRARILVDRTR